MYEKNNVTASKALITGRYWWWCPWHTQAVDPMNGLAQACAVPAALNPQLAALPDDVMYHLGFSRNQLPAGMFTDVKFVLCGGTPSRMAKLAALVEHNLPDVPKGTAENNILQSDRYVMYKVGPVLCVNHGMGAPSISIMLLELIKLLHYAHATDVQFFRIGTSGGLGVAPGTTVVTSGVLNGTLQPYYDQYIFGERVRRAAELDAALVSALTAAGHSAHFPVVSGRTFATDDFYEGQARMDGLFCDFDEKQKFAFLNRLHAAGVLNIEMESAAFAAITHRAGVKAAMVTTTLLDRLQGDQVSLTVDQKHEYEMRPCILVIEYIVNQLTAN